MPSPHQLVLDTMADMLREDINELDSRNCVVSFHVEIPDERNYAHCLFLRHYTSNVAGQEGGLFMDQMQVEMSLFTRTYTDDRQESTKQFMIHSDLLWRCIKRLIHHYLHGLLADPLQVNQWPPPSIERNRWLSSRLVWRCMIGRTTAEMMDEANRER